MSTPPTNWVDLGTNVSDFVEALTLKANKMQRLAAKLPDQDSDLNVKFRWAGAPDVTFAFTVTRSGARVSAGKRSLATKDTGAPKRALTNYNSFLRTRGLFERLCGDLHAGSDDKLSFRDRLGSVVGPKNGTDDPSPWITVAKARSFPRVPKPWRTLLTPRDRSCGGN
jgi:hypothetical protein